MVIALIESASCELDSQTTHQIRFSEIRGCFDSSRSSFPLMTSGNTSCTIGPGKRPHPTPCAVPFVTLRHQRFKRNAGLSDLDPSSGRTCWASWTPAYRRREHNASGTSRLGRRRQRDYWNGAGPEVAACRTMSPRPRQKCR